MAKSKKGARGVKSELLKKYFATNPNATTKEGAKAVGTSWGLASTVKHHGGASDRPKAKKPAAYPVNASANGAGRIHVPLLAGKKPLEMVLGIPDDGVKIRLDRQGRVVGTLIFNADSLQYIRANGRKGAPRSIISFERLAALFESGIL